MRPRLDRILLAVIALIFVVHSAAVALSWYYLYPWIDIPMHIASGFWIGLLFFYLFFERQQILRGELNFIQIAFLCTGFVAFIGAGWEVYEYLLEVFVIHLMPFGGSVPGLHFDTLKDLFDDTVGGALASVWYFYSRK